MNDVIKRGANLGASKDLRFVPVRRPTEVKFRGFPLRDFNLAKILVATVRQDEVSPLFPWDGPAKTVVVSEK